MAALGAARVGQGRRPHQGQLPLGPLVRLKGRRGHAKATVSTGHSILVAAYYMLQREVPYQDLGDDYFHRRDREHAERYRRRLVRQLERLGHKVTLEPHPEAA